MLFARRGIDTYTKLCLNRPLANNSTSFLDGSLYNRTVTVYGDTKWSNGATKFGRNTIYFDGTGDYLLVADSDDFDLGSGNFTIDTWVNLSSPPSTGTKRIICKWDGASMGASFLFFFWWSGTANNLIFRWSIDGLGTPVLQVAGVVSISTGQWHHCAVVKSSATSINLYFDGNLVGASSTEFTAYANSTPLTIGCNLISGSINNLFNGYMAMPRISKGIARWTSNFTPPGNPYV